VSPELDWQPFYPLATPHSLRAGCPPILSKEPKE
jgi:hypothetical protein